MPKPTPMPEIEIWDWVNAEPIDCDPEVVLSVHEWRGVVYVSTERGGQFPLDSIREVRKADGRIWRREGDRIAERSDVRSTDAPLTDGDRKERSDRG